MFLWGQTVHGEVSSTPTRPSQARGEGFLQNGTLLTMGEFQSFGPAAGDGRVPGSATVPNSRMVPALCQLIFYLLCLNWIVADFTRGEFAQILKEQTRIAAV